MKSLSLFDFGLTTLKKDYCLFHSFLDSILGIMERKVQRKSVEVTIDSPSPKKNSGHHDLPSFDELSKKYDVLNSYASSKEEDSSAEKYGALLLEANETISKLHTQLTLKTKQIDQLSILIESLEPTPGVNSQSIQSALKQSSDMGASLDPRDKKIVSLAKKVHNLTFSLNKEKVNVEQQMSINSHLTNQINSLTEELNGLKANLTKNDTKIYSKSILQGNQNSKAVEGDDKGNANYLRELRDCHKEIEELKRKNTSWQDENRGLTRALAKEVGDGVSVEHAVSEGWRGRAQQIVMLKAKVYSFIY